MNRSFLKVAAIVVPVIIVSGIVCSPKTVPDPLAVKISPTELMNAADFHFAFGDGSGLRGYNLVKVQADNSCQYTFLDEAVIGGKQQWRRAEFPLDRQTTDDLRQLLIDIDYFDLKREYHDTRVSDGTQRFVKVEACGKKKGVYCDNYFPKGIEKIRAFVEERIIGSHRQQIGQAVVIDLGQKDMEPELFP